MAVAWFKAVPSRVMTASPQRGRQPGMKCLRASRVQHVVSHVGIQSLSEVRCVCIQGTTLYRDLEFRCPGRVRREARCGSDLALSTRALAG